MKLSLFAGAAGVALAGVAASAQDLMFEPGADPTYNWASFDELKSMDLSGETVSVFGPWLGPDKALVESVIAYFEAATGANVEYSGSDSFELQIVIDTEAGSPPNIAVFPQPGLAADLAGKGLLAPLGDETANWIRENYAAGQSWVDLGSYPGPDGNRDLFGFFYKVDVKSLVWYVPENFEDAGYEVPETMEELKALTDQMVADGETPWCIGIGSGGATGWPATDWVEDMMLRTQPPEVYDAWVSNEMGFGDPRVVNAIDEFGYFARNDDYVAGGGGAVASIDFRTARPACSHLPRSATCNAKLHSFLLSSRKAWSSAKMRTSSISLRTRAWISDGPCSAQAHCSASPRIRWAQGRSWNSSSRRSPMRFGWRKAASSLRIPE